MRRDFYYYIHAEGVYVEGHIWATDEEAAALKKALKDGLRERKYHRPIVEVALGGDYDYAFDEQVRPESVAQDIFNRGGFLPLGEK